MSGFSRTRSTKGRRSEQTAALFFLMLGVTLVAYWPSVQGGPLWDDAGHITIPELRSLRGLWRIWTELGATQQYYPLLHSAFWLEHRIWGDSFTGYRLANIGFHAASAVLVVRILRRLAVPGALFAGLIFALHPVNVESVAWISEQKNTLSTLFYLSAAYVYLGGARTGLKPCATDAGAQSAVIQSTLVATAQATPISVAQPFSAGNYWLAFALFLCALLSKTVTASLPAALLVVIWWKHGRLDWRRDVMPLVPWFAIAAVAGAATAWVERSVIGAKGEAFALTFLERCLLAGRVIWFYLAKLFWPQNLIFVYPRWHIDAAVWWQYLFPVGAVGSAIALGVLARSGRRGPLAGYLYFCATLAPVLGFINVYPFLFSYVADHFQYLASLGIIVPLASALTQASERYMPQRRDLRTVLAAILVAGLGAMTWHRSAVYRDAETLYLDTIRRNPSAWMAYQNLGVELAATSRFSEAIDAFEGALRARPDYPEAKRNLVLARMKLADAAAESPLRAEQAIAQYKEVVRLDPDHFRAHYNLGTLLMDVPERHTEALQHLEAAVRLQPDNVEARVNLGVLLADDPLRSDEAILHLEFAVQRRPDLPVNELLRTLQSVNAKRTTKKQ